MNQPSPTASATAKKTTVTSVLELHRPVDGLVECEHGRLLTGCPPGAGRERDDFGQGVVRVPVCEHCVLVGFGHDLPPAVDLGEWPPWLDGWYHRTWPCPTAEAALLGAAAG